MNGNAAHRSHQEARKNSGAAHNVVAGLVRELIATSPRPTRATVVAALMLTGLLFPACLLRPIDSRGDGGSSETTERPNTGGTAGLAGANGAPGTGGEGAVTGDRDRDGGAGVGGAGRAGAGGAGRAGAGGAGAGGAGAGGAGAGGAGAGGAGAAMGVDAGTTSDAATPTCRSDAGAGSGACCTDGDGDGVVDCRDACPMDPIKSASAGTCGCGVADDDTDRDGVVDCKDGCPQDAARTSPGACGCGVPDNKPLCLVHRYSFSEAARTTIAVDSISKAHGTLVGMTMPGDGTVTLSGGETDQYVSLPSGLISALGDSVTIEAWLIWSGAGGPWQRIFDFGAADPKAPGKRNANAKAYLCLTPFAASNTARAVLTLDGSAEETVVDGPGLLPSGNTVARHVAVVVDRAGKTMRLYLNGALLNSTPLRDQRLSALPDVNNWLGRSQYESDPAFSGMLTEFRIYSAARSDAQVSESASAGPDKLPAR